jgi:hypothetical protein
MRWYCCFSAEHRAIQRIALCSAEKQQYHLMVNLKRIALCSAEKVTIPPHGEFKENSSVLSREVTMLLLS